MVFKTVTERVFRNKNQGVQASDTHCPGITIAIGCHLQPLATYGHLSGSAVKPK